MPSPSSSRAVKRITTHNRTNNNIITATDNAMCKKNNHVHIVKIQFCHSSNLLNYCVFFFPLHLHKIFNEII